MKSKTNVFCDPQHRYCEIPNFSSRAPTLFKQWQYSQIQLEKIKQCLSSMEFDKHGIVALAAAGSYGRMEAAGLSDLDLVVIVENAVFDDGDQGSDCIRYVWELLAPLGIAKPEPHGIFMRPVSVEQLCDPLALGNLEYPRHVFGIRMQLLLDAWPVSNEQKYAQLIRDILCWYTTAGEIHELITPSRYLVGDLIRYFRSYSILHQFDYTRTEHDSWYLREIKMNHSRLVSYVALLGLVCSGPVSTNELISHLEYGLKLTPLERLSIQYQSHQQLDYDVLLQCYDQILLSLVDENTRLELINLASPDVTGNRKQSGDIFDNLISSVRPIGESLTGLLQESQKCWHKDLVSQLYY